jgi:hypothetical protein
MTLSSRYSLPEKGLAVCRITYSTTPTLALENLFHNPHLACIANHRIIEDLNGSTDKKGPITPQLPLLFGILATFNISY